MKPLNSRSGFTLIELLLASVMFALAIGSIVSARNWSLRKVSENRLIAQAQTLAEMKMTEMEIKYQDLIDKSNVRSALGELSGTFEAPYQDFGWTAVLKENPMIVSSDKLIAYLQAYGLSPEESQSQFEQSKLLLSNLNKNLKENMGELGVHVTWKQGGKDASFVLVTHLIPKKPKITFSQSADVDQTSGDITQ